MLSWGHGLPTVGFEVREAVITFTGCSHTAEECRFFVGVVTPKLAQLNSLFQELDLGRILLQSACCCTPSGVNRGLFIYFISPGNLEMYLKELSLAIESLNLPTSSRRFVTRNLEG